MQQGIPAERSAQDAFGICPAVHLMLLHPFCVYFAGLHTSAFFFGHAAMHLIDILVQPAIFMSLYYTLTLPEIKFVDYYTGKPTLSCVLQFMSGPWLQFSCYRTHDVTCSLERSAATFWFAFALPILVT